MSGLESDRRPRFEIATEEEYRAPELQAVPLHLRKEAIERFDREFRIDENRQFEIAAGEKVQNLELSEFLANAASLVRKGEHQLAHGLYRAALKLEPQNEAAVRGLAECAKAQHHHEEAVRVLRKLVETHKTAQNYKLLGDQLYAMEYNADALEAYLVAQQNHELGPEELFEVYKNAGNILLRLGEADAAEEYYNKAYTVNADSDVLRVNFGSLALYRGEYDKALTRFREAVHINDQNDKGWVGLAMIHREYGDGELSWANLEKALDVNPENESAMKLLAEWAMKDGEIEKAIRRLESYTASNGQDALMAMWLAKFLYFSSRLDAALIEIEKALCLDPALEGATDVLTIIKTEIYDRARKAEKAKSP